MVGDRGDRNISERLPVHDCGWGGMITDDGMRWILTHLTQS
jgi:hypothetical protein